MLYQGKQITQPAGAISKNVACVRDLFGVSNERQEAISKAIEDHSKDCLSAKGFDNNRFMLHCPLNLETPNEAALAGYYLARTAARVERMIDMINMMGKLGMGLEDED